MPLGPWELGIILLIVIVIFGAGKLPEIGGAVGKSIREFKSATGEKDEQVAKSETHKETEEVGAKSTPVAKDETVRS